MAIEDYDSLYEYVKNELSDYHYDPTVDDSNEKELRYIRTKWTDEQREALTAETAFFKEEVRMDFDLEKVATRKNFQHWLRIGYSPMNFGAKSLITTKMKTCKSFINEIPLENMQAWMTKQRPGEWVPIHHDVLSSAGVSVEECVQRGQRMLVFLTDWQPGQFMVFGNRTISQWRVGDLLTWPAHKYPHSTANTSFSDGYRLRISGLRTEDFDEWLASLTP